MSGGKLCASPENSSECFLEQQVKQTLLSTHVIKKLKNKIFIFFPTLFLPWQQMGQIVKTSLY